MRVAAVVLLLALSACGGSSHGTAATTPSPDPATASSTAVPDIALPADPLRDLVPRTSDLPPGLVAVLAGSGPRDIHAVAAYSTDPKGAGALLKAHGFLRAYAAQYADPATGHVLSVVVSRFTSSSGADADLGTDLAASSGDKLSAQPVGDRSEVRRQPLPGGKGQLVTVRFRKGATTWLVAWGASPTADPAVAIELAKTLAGRG